MFAHIRRHQKWLWIVISGLVIISFVWYFGPSQQYGTQGGGGSDRDIVGTMYGEPITRGEHREAFEEAMIQYLFSYGEWPRDSEAARQLGLSIEREARTRLLLTRKLADYGIEVSDEAAAAYIRRAFEDPETGQFRRELYERFLQQLPAQGLRTRDFERFARHQVGIQHLAAMAGTPGKLVTPREAAYQYKLENRQVDTKVVTLNTSNYVAQVEITPEALRGYYTNAAARYREPEKIQVSYVEFPISNYLAVAEQKLTEQTNLQERIDMIYAQRGANFYTDENNQVMTPEAAKERIREEAQRELATIEARREANQLAEALIEQLEQNPPQANSPNPAAPLEQMAAEKGLTVQTTQPFSQFGGPAGMNVPAQFSRQAFQLSPEMPFLEQPVVGEDSVYVVFFKNRIPSQMPPFEAKQAQVTRDYTRQESFRLAREAGEALAAALTNAMASGKSFEEAVREAGFEPADIPPFARSTRIIEGLPPGLDSGSVRSASFETAPGEISGFQPSREGGFILFVEELIEADEEEMKEALPEYLAEMRRRNASRAFEDWMRNEAQRANLMLAGDEEQAAGAASRSSF